MPGSEVAERAAPEVLDVVGAVLGGEPVPTYVEPFVTQPSRYSVTSIQAGERCLLAYKLAREFDASGEFAMLGKVFHEIAGTLAFRAYMLRRTTITTDEALATAKAVMERPEEPVPLSFGAHRSILDMTGRWAANVTFDIDAEHYGVEVPAVMPIAGRQVSARIDNYEVRDRVGRIRDWKTGPHVPSEGDVAGHVQLPLYALQLEHQLGITCDLWVCDEVYVAAGITRTVALDRNDVVAVGDYLATALERIDAAWAGNVFPPSPGSWCAYCPRPERCPLPEEYRPAAFIAGADQLREQITALLADKARVKQREESIKAYMDAAGIEQMQIGDQLVGWVQGEEKRLDPKAAEADGVDLDKYRVPKPKRTFTTKKAR